MTFQRVKGLQCFGEEAGGEVNYQTAHVLKQLNAQNGPTLTQEQTIAAAREGNALEPFEWKCEADLDVQELSITHDDRVVAVRVYRPKDKTENLPALLFIHGGCWVFCSVASHDQLCRNYAHALQCAVVSVDYGLAPERPFPHGLLDCAAVYGALQSGNVKGIDGSRLAVAGDSAGGNLSATLCCLLKERGLPQPAAQVLLYPITDISTSTRESHQRYPKDYFFALETLQWTSACYVTSQEDRKHPLVSPFLCEYLSGLAPAHVVIAECDILRDEGLAYVERLQRAGVEVEPCLYHGTVHAFMAMAGAVDLGREAFERSVQFVAEHWIHKSC